MKKTNIKERHCGHAITACNAANVCVFSNEPNLGLYLKKIGPYEVCIFVNIGPFEKTGALLLINKYVGIQSYGQKCLCTVHKQTSAESKLPPQNS